MASPMRTSSSRTPSSSPRRTLPSLKTTRQTLSSSSSSSSLSSYPSSPASAGTPLSSSSATSPPQSSTSTTDAIEAIGEAIIVILYILWFLLSTCLVFLFDSTNVIVSVVKPILQKWTCGVILDVAGDGVKKDGGCVGVQKEVKNLLGLQETLNDKSEKTPEDRQEKNITESMQISCPFDNILTKEYNGLTNTTSGEPSGWCGVGDSGCGTDDSAHKNNEQVDNVQVNQDEVAADQRFSELDSSQSKSEILDAGSCPDNIDKWSESVNEGSEDHILDAESFAKGVLDAGNSKEDNLGKCSEEIANARSATQDNAGRCSVEILGAVDSTEDNPERCPEEFLDVNRNVRSEMTGRKRLLLDEDRDGMEDTVSRTDSGIEMMEPLGDEPTIFGTLAKDKPKHDGSPKRTAPQTTQQQQQQQQQHHQQQHHHQPGHHHVTTAAHKPYIQDKQHHIVGGGDIGRKCNGHHTVTEKSPEIKKEEKTGPALVYQDGSLVSGTLEAFVQHLVPTATYYPDRTYLFAFLLTSRLHIKPHQLLNDVCQVCIRQQRLTSKDVDREAVRKFGPNLMQLLSEWTETFPYDFRDERMMRHLKDITQKCIAIDPTLRKSAGQLMQGLLRRLATLEKYEDVLARVNTAASERMHALRANPASFQMNIMDVCPHPHVLAQQLTHIELERLTNIGPEEFVQSFIKQTDTDGQHMKIQDLKRTKNLEAYVEWFNRLSFLVATEVCMHIKKKHRARLIEYFVDVARECFNIGNFNSLMAIMSGLNMSPVARLKKTWNKINTDKFDCLEHQMDPTSNFGTYRQSLTAAMQRAMSAQEGACDKIVIPFFSLLVKDLYFLNEGCSNKLPTGYLNFEKFWQLAKQVTNFMTWKSVECPYPRDRQALNYLLTAPVFSENSLNLASYESESPETDFEKNQYKSLKLQCTSTTAKSS